MLCSRARKEIRRAVFRAAASSIVALQVAVGRAPGQDDRVDEYPLRVQGR
jgi:hypothetical protein